MSGLQPAPAASRPRIKIAVSTYSYWHFRQPRYPVEKVIEDAARLGFDGVEILHRQMESETPEYVNRLEQAAFRRGLALPMLSIHQDFISPKKEERDEAPNLQELGTGSWESTSAAKRRLFSGLPYNRDTCGQPTSGTRATTTGWWTASGRVRRTPTCPNTSA